MKKFYTLSFILFSSISVFSQVVISQVYGGGGNSGGQFSNDFIELFNRGTVAQSLNGWSVQYTSATGPSTTGTSTSWAMTVLPNFTLQPGQYYLIQQAAGATASVALPTPDVNGVSAATTNADGTPLITGFAMSGTTGKVILCNVATQQTGVNPTGAQIIDKVGYGTTPTGFEGTGPTGTALTNTTAAIRNNSGCADTNSNPTDFTAAAPTPRNSTTTVVVCSLSTNQSTIAGLSIYPNPVSNGNLFVTSDSNESKNVTIFDVLGKKVLSTTVTDQAVNVSTLNSGVYFVKVTENGNTATRKLVINN